MFFIFAISNNDMNKKVLLLILDGWGITQDSKVSAIAQANTPFIDSLYKNYPNAEVRTDGLNVGLPEGQMGNSEVGHMNLGAGRIVYQDLAKVNLAIEQDTLKKEPVLTQAFDYAKKYQKNIHFLGLLSDGGVHSHINHLKGLISAAHNEGLKHLYVHAFTDGRDVDPKSGLSFIKELEKHLTASKVLDDLDSYHLKGGYGSGEIDGPDKYLKPAKSKFQREMRKKTGYNSSDETWNTRIPNHTNIVQRRMRKIQSGATLDSLKGSDLETAKHSHRVIHKERTPNITVVSIPDDYIHYNTDLPRTLSVRECARLQTFPDHFRFLGKRTTGGERRRFEVPQYTQVANAIPPRLARTIGEHLLTYLD